MIANVIHNGRSNLPKECSFLEKNNLFLRSSSLSRKAQAFARKLELVEDSWSF
jgi:hypothetical protein